MRAPSPALAAGIAAVACAAATLAAPAGATAAARSQSVDALVATAARYVREYQRAFAFLVADETTVQEVSASVPVPGPTSRTTTGEMFVTYLAAESQWTSVHDVAAVDGVPVADRDDLSTLLRDHSIGSLAPRLFARNARFNIGSVQRNFNDPMLALLVIGDRRRDLASFSRASASADRDGFVTIAFRERRRPTLVRDTAGRPVFARGELTIDPDTGAIQRTWLALGADGVEAELTTTFAFDAGVDSQVPVMFTERYASTREGRREVTNCESRYTNYRRFDVAVRIQ